MTLKYLNKLFFFYFKSSQKRNKAITKMTYLKKKR